MARVTVEDCVEKEPNRFDLVMIAAQRARDISAGSALTVDRDNDKNPVVALREIADSTVELDDLREGLVKIHQKHVEADEAEEEIIELMAGEEDWLSKGLMPEDTAETPEAEDVGATVEGASGEAVDEGDGSQEGQGADLGAGIDPDKMDELAREVEAALDIQTGVAADDEGAADEGPTNEGPTDEGPTDEGSADEGPTDEGPADDGAAGEGTDDENR